MHLPELPIRTPEMFDITQDDDTMPNSDKDAKDPSQESAPATEPYFDVDVEHMIDNIFAESTT